MRLTQPFDMINDGSFCSEVTSDVLIHLWVVAAHSHIVMSNKNYFLIEMEGFRRRNTSSPIFYDPISTKNTYYKARDLLTTTRTFLDLPKSSHPWHARIQCHQPYRKHLSRITLVNHGSERPFQV